MDAIQSVIPGSEEPKYETYLGYQRKFHENLWGVSTGSEHNVDHIEMTIHFEADEKFILQRLEREKRHGSVEILDDHTRKFVADVYDASEMLPWLRTFIGRIVDLKCSSEYVVKTFYEDLEKMCTMYGGEPDAIQ